MKVFFALLASLAAAGSLSADLKTVLAEVNLEKRSRLALENAEGALKEARKAYDSGNMKQSQLLMDETLASIELADESLRQTGKNPRKKPKHFKYAEMKTRNLLRNIESFENSMSYTDRSVIEKLKARTRQIHEELLAGIMGQQALGETR